MKKIIITMVILIGVLITGCTGAKEKKYNVSEDIEIIKNVKSTNYTVSSEENIIGAINIFESIDNEDDLKALVSDIEESAYKFNKATISEDKNAEDERLIIVENINEEEIESEGKGIYVCSYKNNKLIVFGAFSHDLGTTIEMLKDETKDSYLTKDILEFFGTVEEVVDKGENNGKKN